MVRWKEAIGRADGIDPRDERTRDIVEKLDVHSLDNPHYSDAVVELQGTSDRRSAMQRLFLTALSDAREQTLRGIQESN